ncbi:hypothetical protein Ancab_021158 [Ancistrocladus abbreviatus]
MVLLCHVVEEASQSYLGSVDILELNRLRRSLLISSRVWDHRLYSLDSQLSLKGSNFEGTQDTPLYVGLKDWRSDSYKDAKSDGTQIENLSDSPKVEDSSPRAANFEVHLPVDCNLDLCQHVPQGEIRADGETTDNAKSSEIIPYPASSLSDKIDSAWTGTDQQSCRTHLPQLQSDVLHSGQTRLVNPVENHLPFSRLMAPLRFHSFESVKRLQERLHRRLPPSSLQFSTVKSFHAFGDYSNMVTDPVSSRNNLVIAVYDDEPTSIISYALSSKEHEDWISSKMNEHEGSNSNRKEYATASLSPWQSCGSLDLDYMNYGSYRSEDASSRISSLFTDSKTSPHLRISFEDECSSAGGNAKFSVTCYFAKQFDLLRKRCCPSEVDFVRSLSRCKRWSAQGGKSNVYFAKSMDERFAVKHLSGGRETKMDLMVMENLFFKRSISKVYDLKGSSRSRYIPDSTGTNKVLLDMNLLETATYGVLLILNLVMVLQSVDVMDYSLLVGMDNENKELVLGIIDFMRQYTWDKHLETWVKASGILGGPKNASSTIISPKQYKIRFRKAMTAYFLTVPDQWSS